MAKYKMVSIMIPRALKSSTSAKKSSDPILSRKYKVGDQIELKVSDDIYNDVTRFWTMYPFAVYWEGGVDEYKKMVSPQAFKAAQTEAAGTMEWVENFDIGVDENGVMLPDMAAPVVSKEQAPVVIPDTDKPIVEAKEVKNDKIEHIIGDEQNGHSSNG